MEKRLLLTRTRHDIGNQYLYAYSEEILSEAEKRGWKIHRVEDEKNNEQEIVSRLDKTRPNFVFFNGHGNEETIYGHDNQKIVGLASSSSLSDKIVFARSCSALKKLGQKAVRDGCKAFIGYKGEFLIPRLHSYESTPKQDPVAKPVLEVSNMVGQLILKGDKVGVATDAAQRKASDLILKMLTSEEPYHAATFRALYQNFNTLSFEGDAQARV